MATHSAIETSYAGYRFRSRLEARWAVFFDFLGIKWLYEPEGFEKQWFVGNVRDRESCSEEEFNSPENEIYETERYLPDFFLPETETWVEVKGNMTGDEALKLAKFLDWGSPLPNIDGGAETTYVTEPRLKRVAYGLLLLGDIPEPIHGYHLHPIIQHSRGLRRNFVEFLPDTWPQLRLQVHTLETLYWVRILSGIWPYDESYGDAYCMSIDDARDMFSTAPFSFGAKLAHHKVTDAYAAARGARFEYGETPIPIGARA